MPASFNKPLESGFVLLKMNRCILILIAVLIITSSFAQSDFIQLKKNDKVLQTWFKDNDIYMQLKNGQWINAIIYKIEKDSLYLRPYIVQTFVTNYLVDRLDCVYW